MSGRLEPGDSAPDFTLPDDTGSPLTLSDLRDRCPDKVSLFGIIPQSYDAGVELSPLLAGKLAGLAELVLGELRAVGHEIVKLAA